MAREGPPSEAFGLMARGARLLDVRDAPELLAGTALGSIHVAHRDLAMRVAAVAPDATAALSLICASGALGVRRADFDIRS